MKHKDHRKKAGKKAFIAGALVDIWSMLFFVIVIIVFYFLYKWSAEASMQAIQDKQDIIYGNYLAQVYLRTPITVAGERLTVAELIAMYDYNQTLELEQADEASYAEWAREVITDNPITYMLGRVNPMRTALISITDDFVEKNFDDDRCFRFEIHGNSFDYSRSSNSCPGARGFGVHYLFSALRSVPKETFLTYIAPVDPRADPILVYSIYDFQRLLSLYSPDRYFDMTDAEQWALNVLCADPRRRLLLPSCFSRDVASATEIGRQVGEALRDE